MTQIHIRSAQQTARPSESQLLQIPCPVVRSVAASGALGPDLSQVSADSIKRAFAALAADPKVGNLGALIALIGGNATRSSALDAVRNVLTNLITQRVDLTALRGSLIDKPFPRDTGVLDKRADGRPAIEEFERLTSFAGDFSPKAGGPSEKGFDQAAIDGLIEANMARMKSNPVGAKIDEAIARGEFKPLLDVFGQESTEGKKYVPLSYLSSLYIEHTLPPAFQARIDALLEMHGNGSLAEIASKAAETSGAALGIAAATGQPNGSAGVVKALTGLCPFMNAQASNKQD